MPFIPGQDKPEGSGIQKGTKHKKTEQWELLSDYLIGEGLTRFMQILAEADDKEYAKYFITLLEYFKPKLNKIDAKFEPLKDGENVLEGLTIICDTEGNRLDGHEGKVNLKKEYNLD